MRHFPKRLLLLLLFGLIACAPSAQPAPTSHHRGGGPVQRPNLVWDFRVPETDLTVTLNDAFWQGAPISFRGPGRDRGTVQRVAKPLRLEEGESLFLLAPLEVQRVSGAGGLYLVALKESGKENGTENDLEKETQGSAFLSRNVALLGLDHIENVITATVADARLGRPPSATMQPGRTYRFRLQEGKLLELD